MVCNLKFHNLIRSEAMRMPLEHNKLQKKFFHLLQSTSRSVNWLLSNNQYFSKGNSGTPSITVKLPFTCKPCFQFTVLFTLDSCSVHRLQYRQNFLHSFVILYSQEQGIVTSPLGNHSNFLFQCSDVLFNSGMEPYFVT